MRLNEQSGEAQQRARVDPAFCQDPDLLRVLQQLRPFQRQAFDHATAAACDASKTLSSTSESLLGNGRLLLCDEMGLGKSVISLAIMMQYRQEWPLLILCPASLRYTWPAEIEKFVPGLPPSAIYVVQGFDDADFFENNSKRSKIQIVVATYSLLQNRSAAAQVLKQFKFRCVIADESHNLKQKNSQRALLAFPLLETATRLILLSGTPALARPVELWTQVYALAPDLFGSYTAFTKQYCNARSGRFGWDVSGLSNADELHAKLKKIMIRRLKADVLDDLPPKQRSMIPIPISKTKRKECEGLILQLRDTRQSIKDLVGDEAYGANFEARRLLMEAYQASGVAKADGVCEYLLEWLRGSGSQKVLIFAHHKAVLDSIEVAVAKELKGAGHIRIDGTVNAQERAVRVKKFQSSKNIRVAILSVTAAGVGLTLTAASSVMFAELHWTPGVLAQAEDRCHRIGQRNAVNIMYLICEDPTMSVDMQLWEMLGRKVNNLGRVVDGERSAHLDAKRGQDPDSASQRDRMSGQEELQSFFADMAHNTEKGKTAKNPAKGTILSFFAKQQQGIQDKTLSLSQETLPTNTPEAFVSTKSSPESEKFQWDCKTCTFMNSRRRSNSGRLECEMCGACLIDDGSDDKKMTSHRRSHLVTPRSGYGTDPRRPKQTVLLQREATVVNVVEEHQEHSVDHSTAESFPRPSDEIVLLDEGIERTSQYWTPKLKRMKIEEKLKSSSWKSQPVIEIDDENSIDDEKRSHGELLFSVSKNSGRIMIHYEKSKEASLVSFDLEEVLTNEVVDHMMETKLDRKHTRTPISLEFVNTALVNVVGALDRRKIGGTTTDLDAEIKSFVTQYVALREIEKKRLKESGEVFAAMHLRQQILRWTPQGSFVGSSTERYAGGAKEHARSRMELGTASATDMAVLEGRLCAFCAGELSTASRNNGVISTYCSKECAEDGRLKRGGMYASTQIRTQVFALEGGVCRLCGVDAHALYTRIASLAPAERLNALCNAHWKLPMSSKGLERLLQHPKEGDFWQADHIQAVAEGGGGCDLENLRTLCTPCHAVETEKLRGRLRLAGPSGGGSSSSQEESNSSMRQTDIRSMFGQK